MTCNNQQHFWSAEANGVQGVHGHDHGAGDETLRGS
jgi:hypothetical protein